MWIRRLMMGMSACLAGCSNNNVAVTATEAMQTSGSFEDGDADEDTSNPTGGSPASESTVGQATTAGPDTTATSDGTSGASTGIDATTTATTSTTSTSTSSGSTTSADDTDTTSGGTGGPPRYAVFNHCLSFNFHVLDLENMWSAVTPTIPNQGAQMAVGVSNEHVYYHSQETNVVSRYAFATDSWLPHLAGPAAITTSRGWVEWVGGDNVCLAYVGRNELFCHDGDAWQTIGLTIKSDAWASYDPVQHELYVKVRDNVGFQVVDLETYEIVRTITGKPHNIYTNCFFDYHDGYVYIDDFPDMRRLDSQTGDSTPFHVPPLMDESRRGAGVHPTTGKIYLASDINFYAGTPIQEYDFAAKQVTLLPYEPVLSTSHRVVFQPYE